MSDVIVDILIIGGGFAGLSAAASIVRQAHSTVILDSGSYRNAKTRHFHTLATWDHRDPAEFRAAARHDFERYGTVNVKDAEVVRVEKVDKGFKATTANGENYIGEKLILATGVEDVYPEIEGYADCWVSGIFHCLYCHGWEERGAASSGIIASGDIAAVVPALHFARQGLRLSDSVTIYTNGNTQLASDIDDVLKEHPADMVVDSRKITKLVKAPERAQVTLQLDDGSSKTEAWIAHKPKTKLKGNLAEQLGLELTSKGTIAVSQPFNQTSVKGVFAAGDCSSLIQTVTSAMNSGTMTGGGAPLQLQAERLGQQPIF